MSENGYIYIEKGLVYIQCEKCYKQNKRGLFWAATNGYGGTVKCKCGHVIHETEKKVEHGGKS